MAPWRPAIAIAPSGWLSLRSRSFTEGGYRYFGKGVRREGGRSPPGAFPLLDLATQSRHDANAFLARSLSMVYCIHRNEDATGAET